MQQGLDYADTLDVPFVFSSNGDGFLSVEGRIDEGLGAMKRKVLGKSSKKTSSATSASLAGLDSLIGAVRNLVNSARHAAATAVNTLQVLTNFEIGRRIVEHEQQGTKRASYGIELLNVLSAELTQEFGSGFSATNLKLMRQFFVEYSGRIGQTLSDQFAKPKGLRATSRDASNSFTLSWSHYVLLLTIPDDNERRFYEIEATTDQKVRSQALQKTSLLYLMNERWLEEMAINHASTRESRFAVGNWMRVGMIDA